MYLAAASGIDQIMDQSGSLFFVRKAKIPLKILRGIYIKIC